MEKLDDFKRELAALLEKYGATIGCDLDGDTHGLICEMVVDFGSSDKWKNYKLCNGSEVSYSDIKETAQ